MTTAEKVYTASVFLFALLSLVPLAVLQLTLPLRHAENMDVVIKLVMFLLGLVFLVFTTTAVANAIKREPPA